MQQKLLQMVSLPHLKLHVPWNMASTMRYPAMNKMKKWRVQDLGYSKWFLAPSLCAVRLRSILGLSVFCRRVWGEERSNDHNLNDPLRCLTPKTLSEATDYFRLLHDLVIPAKTRVPSRFSHLIMTTYENSKSWSNSDSLMNELGGMLRFFGLKGWFSLCSWPRLGLKVLESFAGGHVNRLPGTLFQHLRCEICRDSKKCAPGVPVPVTASALGRSCQTNSWGFSGFFWKCQCSGRVCYHQLISGLFTPFYTKNTEKYLMLRNRTWMKLALSPFFGSIWVNYF